MDAEEELMESSAARRTEIRGQQCRPASCPHFQNRPTSEISKSLYFTTPPVDLSATQRHLSPVLSAPSKPLDNNN